MSVSVNIPQIVLPDTYNAASTFLDRNVEEGRGERIAVDYEDQQWTYRQMQALANRIGNGLRTWAWSKSSASPCCCSIHPDWPPRFWGRSNSAQCPFPSTPRCVRLIMSTSSTTAAPKVLVVDAALWPQIAGIHSQLQYVRQIVVVGRDELDAGEEQGGLLDFDTWIAGALRGAERRAHQQR